MQHSDVRPAPHRSSARAFSCALLLAIAAACGNNDVTAPTLVNTGPENTGTPDVSGFYTRVENDPAATCTPNTPPAGGTVILGTFTESQPIKLYQNGTRITLAYVNTPQLPADTGRVDVAGKITLGIQGLGMKENLRNGRQFYVDLSGSAQLTPSQGGTKYTGTGNYSYIFHEDSPTAAVYATCTRTVAFDFTKTG
jgi:hypothetical protein